MTTTAGYRSRRARRILVAALGALAIGATAALAGMPAAAQQTEETASTSDVISSPNMRQLANIPKQEPFDNTAAFGTDLAFTGDYAIAGNYDGFVIYDISKPRKPRIASQVHCSGSQNDVSVTGDLLFLSTDVTRSSDSCDSEPVPRDAEGAWEGIKIFDISDKHNPRYLQSVQTKCGSHTHTLVPDDAGENAYLYVSSYSPAPEFTNCTPPHDLISIVQVPLDDPESASVLDEPVLFPEGGHPGTPGEFPDNYTTQTTGCHDITVYPSKDLAAGACMGDGILMDISDRTKPKVIEQVQDDESFAFWHSATFNNAGTKVVFTDELGGGGAPACGADIGANRGADGIYDITEGESGPQLEFRSYFKIDRVQQDSENCVAHNGSLLPVKGKDIMVQAWYQGGVAVWDFTDSANPEQIGFWERGPFADPDGQPATAGSWSAYYYNGHIYSSDIQEGLDVLDINDPRTNPAKQVKMDEFNAQTQGEYPE
ncbi:LVIVD repeat-containing protein [Tamaricihabitans halophyticus]|uniref:LVIVD repeat-containing protein n=1 Tax=Tamaricihabitans halophyticus TaxID=1262583 RepID=A0A4R2QCQ1_9PSEU|nr:hypothetical protein [Tamaricihabitans halophyticus]TCP46800.1 LVIVD repeat-containing protein [Tamaricihabitans halophyticus]